LVSIVNAWQTRRDEIDQSADKMNNHLKRNLILTGNQTGLSDALFEEATAVIAQSYDPDQGGFSGAPKFPPSMTIEFLLRMYLQNRDERTLLMAEHTLVKMAHGGMYDQLGGGFARYSTDSDWLVPHFEKMLYDNALLSRVYLHAWQITNKPVYRRIVEEILDFVVREMRHESGGFYSSYDADSEGVEGKFYVWQSTEIKDVLGDDADLFMLYYDMSERGNWEGKNILNVPREPEIIARTAKMEVEEMEAKLAEARRKLYEVRARRTWPGLDDKVLTAWNGLMLASFAEAGQALNRPDYTEVAVKNAMFLNETMRLKNGRLLRTWKAGSDAKYNGYLEDYANLIDGLLALYQNNFDERWFEWASELTDMMLAHFSDKENGGFFDTSDDHEQLIQRPKDIQDNAVPSGNGMAAQILLKMSLFTGVGKYWDIAEKAILSIQELLAKHPTAFAHWLSSALLLKGEPKEVAIVGSPGTADTDALLAAIQVDYRPNIVVAVGSNGNIIPLLAGRESKDGKATAYVCRQFICKMPVTETDALLKLLD